MAAGRFYGHLISGSGAALGIGRSGGVAGEGLVPLVLAVDEHGGIVINIVEHHFHGRFRYVDTAVGTAGHIVVAAEVGAPGRVVQTDHIADYGDPVFDEDAVILACERGVGLRVVSSKDRWASDDR